MLDRNSARIADDIVKLATWWKFAQVQIVGIIPVVYLD